jgi:hypothetical protein
MKLLAMLVFLLPLKIWGQASNKDTLLDDLAFKTLEQVLENSVKITSETFDLKFLLRALPDNGWFLKLNKDATYEYIFWSGYGSSEGTILEKGNYSITDNLLHLESENNHSDLEHIQFYLVSSLTETIDNNITIDCQKASERVYCLYRSY